MNINGQKIETGNMINFFPNYNPDEASEESSQRDDREILRAFKEANDVAYIPKRFHNVTFDTIESDYNDQLKGFCLAPLDRIVILFGGVGTGKTSLLCSSIHERALKGLSYGLYHSDLTLPVTLRTCRSFTAKENEESFLRRLSTTSFLALDEFGVCKNLTEESDFVSTVLRLRYDNALPTLIATNLSPISFKLTLCGFNPSDYTKEQAKELADKLRYENATLNRVMSVATAYTVAGPSRR